MAYEVRTTDEFGRWLDDLADPVAVNAIAKRIVRVEGGLFGDAEPVGDGVTELRFHIGPGYRVYFTTRRRQIVFLLVGGDKSTQTKDIKLAKELAKQIA